MRKELTIKIDQELYWTESTSVWTWLQSDQCNYKVFVETCVAEIQDLTDPKAWCYTNSELNPADDIWGLTLSKLSVQTRWNQGPQLLTQPVSNGPKQPLDVVCDDIKEFCGVISCSHTDIPDITHYNSLQDLIKDTAVSLHGVVDKSQLSAVD